MVLPTGFEPVTTDLEGQCSNQLSYGSFCLIWLAGKVGFEPTVSF